MALSCNNGDFYGSSRSTHHHHHPYTCEKFVWDQGYIQGYILASILAALIISLVTNTINFLRQPSAIFLHGKQQGVNRFGAKWPPPISKTTSIQLNFEKPQTMLNELRLKIYQNICVRKSPVNAGSKKWSGLNHKASTGQRPGREWWPMVPPHTTGFRTS